MGINKNKALTLFIVVIIALGVLFFASKKSSTQNLPVNSVKADYTKEEFEEFKTNVVTTTAKIAQFETQYNINLLNLLLSNMSNYDIEVFQKQTDDFIDGIMPLMTEFKKYKFPNDIKSEQVKYIETQNKVIDEIKNSNEYLKNKDLSSIKSFAESFSDKSTTSDEYSGYEKYIALSEVIGEYEKTKYDFASDDTDNTTNATETTTQKRTQSVATTEKPTNSATTGQTNALKKAKQYLDYSAFSRKGLIEQLEYEGFTNEQAVYGVNNCGADWKEQAAKKAKQYLDYSAFSRKELIEQLEYEGFTNGQAIYGVEANGY